jgi:hypothetical protein
VVGGEDDSIVTGHGLRRQRDRGQIEMVFTHLWEDWNMRV